MRGFEISGDQDRIDVDVVHRYLSDSSYWAKGCSRESVTRALANSLCFGAYESTGAMIGFGRLVTDHSTFAWLSDVFVLDEHQGRGIGKALTQFAVDQARGYGVRRLVLATLDAHDLYRQFGFTDPRPNFYMELPINATTKAHGHGKN